MAGYPETSTGWLAGIGPYFVRINFPLLVRRSV